MTKPFSEAEKIQLIKDFDPLILAKQLLGFLYLFEGINIPEKEKEVMQKQLQWCVRVVRELNTYIANMKK